ncbi:MAG: putative baseplate assembly protein, partial [Blastocatellia bacterium]
QVASISRNQYGISGKSTQIDFELVDQVNINNDDILTTKVFIQSEKLILAEEPLTNNVSGNSVDLEGLPDGIESGRWMIISGELDIPDINGVRESELVMVVNVERVDEPGSKVRAKLTFANTLKQMYKRDTVRIYGNVVRATQGETVIEVLGSGDATKVFQRFSVKRPPITFLPAATPSGSQTTLQVRVNDLLWNEAVDPTSLGSADQGFVTRRDDDGKTSVLFGNGKNGLRLPTGIENVTAQYRTGLSKSGNVKAGQISLLAAKPTGVKEVINPLAASGGANPDGRDLIRTNAPLAVLALDRLVSVNDYEAFCRMFAGIGKAQATRISNRSRQVVFITIAGIDDILIDINSDLYRSLVSALHRYGDPYQPLQVAIRDLIQLVISAKIRIDPRYLWQKVEQRIRRTLLDVFSFERRQLGQDVTSSEVISTIQRVDGVQYVDLEVLQGLSREYILSKFDNQKISLPNTTSQAFNTRISVNGTRAGSDGRILPAQIAYLTPEIPQTLILNLV